MSQFQQLLSQHIATSLLKQQVLGDFLGEYNWQVNISAGTVDFGKGRVYPLQIIGTESEITGTWLWGWANTQSNVPPGLLICGQALRELGEKENIEELRQAQFDLDEVDGHSIAIIASGVCKADAYFRGPYEGGDLFFLITGTPLPAQLSTSTLEHVNMMSSVISQFPVHHRLMAQSFLQQQGYDLSESASEIIASSASGDKISIRFDELERMIGIETTAKPETETIKKTSKKPWWRRSR